MTIFFSSGYWWFLLDETDHWAMGIGRHNGVGEYEFPPVAGKLVEALLRRTECRYVGTRSVAKNERQINKILSVKGWDMYY